MLASLSNLWKWQRHHPYVLSVTSVIVIGRNSRNDYWHIFLFFHRIPHIRNKKSIQLNRIWKHKIYLFRILIRNMFFLDVEWNSQKVTRNVTHIMWKLNIWNTPILKYMFSYVCFWKLNSYKCTNTNEIYWKSLQIQFFPMKGSILNWENIEETEGVSVKSFAINFNVLWLLNVLNFNHKFNV